MARDSSTKTKEQIAADQETAKGLIADAETTLEEQ